MKRLTHALVVLVTVHSLTSCATPCVVHQADLLSPAASSRSARFTRTAGQDVSGYTPIDGGYRRFAGKARLVADSLVFFRPGERDLAYTNRGQVRFGVAVRDLESVTSVQPDRTRTLVVGMAVVTVLTGALLVITIGGASKVY